MWLLEYGPDSNDSIDISSQPSLKRPRVDDDGLIAEAVLAYVAKFNDDLVRLRDIIKQWTVKIMIIAGSRP